MPTTPFSWRCPFCGQYGTITDEHYKTFGSSFSHGNRHQEQFIWGEVTVCPNPDCAEYTLRESLHDYPWDASLGRRSASPAHHEWQLVPPAEMEIIPDYVPQAIVGDYEEACLIRDLSPKASATMARRCLQGMIRDFWGIKKTRLKDEIDALADVVDGNTWAAIDAVRSVGNIGAHMEKDIDLVIDVEPEEAQLLIGLIETLVQDWYVTRREKEVRLQKVKALAESKAEQRLKGARTPD